MNMSGNYLVKKVYEAQWCSG